VDGQTQPRTTDWLTVFIDDQVTVKLRGHARVGELGNCREWVCRFEAKVQRYKFSQLSAIRFLDLHSNNSCRFVAHLSAKFLMIKCHSAGT
jgi:hypothetical protein